MADLLSVDWLQVFTGCRNLNEVWENFLNIDIVNNVIQNRVPLKRSRSRNGKDKYPKHIRKLISKKRGLDRKLKIEPNREISKKIDDLDLEIRNQQLEHVKVEEAKFLQNARGDQKKFYRYVATKLKSKSRIAALSGPHGIVFDDHSKAEIFSDHYKSVFINDPVTSYDYQDRGTQYAKLHILHY
jgi:hypothetical protein